MNWTKVNERPWPLILIKAHVLSLVDCIYQLFYPWLQQFLKIHCFNFFLYKSIQDQIWSCCKIGQDQSWGIIWTNLVALEYPMLHTKLSAFRFQRRRFLKDFTIYGHGSHLSHVTWTIWTSFCFLIPRRLHIKFGFNQPSDYWGKKVKKYKCIEPEWLGPRSINDLDLWYSWSFMYSFSWLHLPTLIS